MSFFLKSRVLWQDEHPDEVVVLHERQREGFASADAYEAFLAALVAEAGGAEVCCKILIHVLLGLVCTREMVVSCKTAFKSLACTQKPQGQFLLVTCLAVHIDSVQSRCITTFSTLHLFLEH